jgi:hypothetical protein
MDSDSREGSPRPYHVSEPTSLPPYRYDVRARQEQHTPKHCAVPTNATGLARAELSHSFSPNHDAKAQARPMEIWISNRPRIASLRGVILVMRTNLRRERLQCRRQEELEQGLLAQCYAHIDGFTADKTGDEQLDRFNEAYTKLKLCKADLTSLRERTAAFEDALSNHEYQLDRLEETVYSDMIQLTQQEETQQTIQAPSSFLHPALPIDNGQDHSLDLRDRLYMRMGDIRIYHERLSNFEFDLRERAEERDLIRAEGTRQISTDAVFFEQARAQRLRIHEEHIKAHEDVRLLKQQCVQRGIEFEEPDFVNSISCTLLEDPSPTSDSTHAPSNLVGDYFASQDRVQTWLGEPIESRVHVLDDHEGVDGYARRRDSASSDMSWISEPNSEKRSAPDTSLRRHSSAPYNISQWRMTPPLGSTWPDSTSLSLASIRLDTALPHSRISNLPRSRHSLSMYQ